MDYKCKIVSPMFIYGAKPDRAELRVPSIKGALRFWWRALNPESDWKKIRKQEGLLFGNTEQRSKIVLRLKDRPKGELNDNFIDKYYFQKHKNKGRGLNDNQKNLVEELQFISYGVFNKTYLPPSEKEFILNITKKCTEEEYKTVSNALKMMTLFGGLGGKARNGFGSFEITNEGFKFDEEEIKNLMCQFKDVEQKTYTSFSKDARLFKMVRSNKKWGDVLKTFANFYKTNKKDKHSLEVKHRKYIGYPGEKLNGKLIGIEGLERHTKSYFFNVIKNGDKYDGLLLYLPYDFLNGIENTKDSKFTLERRKEEAANYKAAQAEFLQILRAKLTFKEIKL